MTSKIRVIIFQEGDAWVAQGLERDICVQAVTMNDLYGRFEVAVHLEAEQPGGLERIDPAPQYIHDMWAQKSTPLDPEWEPDEFYEYGIAA